MKRIISGFLIAGLLFLAGCETPAPESPVDVRPAPALVSSDPADGAKDLKGSELTITLTFDQNIKCPSDQRAKISIDNGAAIDNITLGLSDMKIEVSGLESGETYTLVVPAGVVQGFGSNQKASEEIRVTFSMKLYIPSELNPVTSLVNPNATQEAKNVYNFLLEQSGKKTLSGVQSADAYKNDFVNAVYQQTGKHPALAGYDFLFLQYSPTPSSWDWVRDYNDISAAKEQWAANGLVNYMWHWNVPNSKGDWEKGKNYTTNNYNFSGYSFYSDRTSFDINQALTEGTWQNDFIMEDIKEVAGYLKLLQDANIPVIWRPLHEAAGNYDLYGSNGAWFWWGRGGAEPCKKLWKLLYDQLVNVYGLDNLIWVWTVDVTAGCEDQYADWYPGNDYVDIVGFDVYVSNTDAKTTQYQALVDVTGGKKLVTISECGNIPDPEKCMNALNQWSWFMVWPNTDTSGNIIMTPSDPNYSLNTSSYWQQVMNSEYVLTREDMPSLK